MPPVPSQVGHCNIIIPALQGVRDRYNGSFGDHAATMTHFMWQHDIRAVAQLIKEYVEAHGNPGPQSQASDQPGWLETMCSLSLFLSSHHKVPGMTIMHKFGV